MKFLYTYCSHIKGSNPLYRKGNYYEDIKAKIKEIVFLSGGVDMVVHGGDFGDAPMMALGVADEIVDMIEAGGIPWYIVRGNHDEIGHNPNLSGESILDHIFRRSKLIRHLDIVQDNVKTVIQGFDFYHGIEKDLNEKGLYCSVETDGKKIAVIHAFITDKSLPFRALHSVISKIKTDFDLVLIAHNHTEMGIIKYGKTSWISIGSLARITSAKSDINRMPNVLYVDTLEPSLKIIPLKCGRPVEDAFNLELVDKIKEREGSIESFIKSLESTKVKGLNLKGIIEELCEKEAVDKEVLDEIIDRIGATEQ